ncbi:MAG: hypothetical protein WC227_04675 [Patescibacteria group bacterium]|jgi:hypothetical protein
MKIVICASVVFSKEIIGITEKLEKEGHTVDIPFVTKLIRDKKISLDQYIADKDKEGDIKYREQYRDQVDMIKRYYGLINDCDAILVLNYDKKDIPNYIGGSVLMEMGFAYVLDKKIFLLNPIPEMSYSDELKDCKPIVISGELSKIK